MVNKCPEGMVPGPEGRGCIDTNKKTKINRMRDRSSTKIVGSKPYPKPVPGPSIKPKPPKPIGGGGTPPGNPTGCPQLQYTTGLQPGIQSGYGWWEASEANAMCSVPVQENPYGGGYCPTWWQWGGFIWPWDADCDESTYGEYQEGTSCVQVVGCDSYGIGNSNAQEATMHNEMCELGCWNCVWCEMHGECISQSMLDSGYCCDEAGNCQGDVSSLPSQGYNGEYRDFDIEFGEPSWMLNVCFNTCGASDPMSNSWQCGGGCPGGGQVWCDCCDEIPYPGTPSGVSCDDGTAVENDWQPDTSGTGFWSPVDGSFVSSINGSWPLSFYNDIMAGNVRRITIGGANRDDNCDGECGGCPYEGEGECPDNYGIKNTNNNKKWRKCSSSAQCADGITCEVPGGCYACCKGDISSGQDCVHMFANEASGCELHSGSEWSFHGPDPTTGEGGFVCDKCVGCGTADDHVCTTPPEMCDDDFSKNCECGSLVTCADITNDATNDTCGEFAAGSACQTEDCVWIGEASFSGCCDDTACNASGVPAECSAVNCTQNETCLDWDACGVCGGPGETLDCNGDGSTYGCSVNHCYELLKTEEGYVPGENGTTTWSSTYSNQSGCYCCPDGTDSGSYPDAVCEDCFDNDEWDIADCDLVSSWTYPIPSDCATNDWPGWRSSFCDMTNCVSSDGVSTNQDCGMCTNPCTGETFWPWSGWDPEDYVHGCGYFNYPNPDHCACKSFYGQGGSASACGYGAGGQLEKGGPGAPPRGASQLKRGGKPKRGRKTKINRMRDGGKPSAKLIQPKLAGRTTGIKTPPEYETYAQQEIPKKNVIHEVGWQCGDDLRGTGWIQPVSAHENCPDTHSGGSGDNEFWPEFCASDGRCVTIKGLATQAYCATPGGDYASCYAGDGACYSDENCVGQAACPSLGTEGTCNWAYKCLDYYEEGVGHQHPCPNHEPEDYRCCQGGGPGGQIYSDTGEDHSGDYPMGHWSPLTKHWVNCGSECGQTDTTADWPYGYQSATNHINFYRYSPDRARGCDGECGGCPYDCEDGTDNCGPCPENYAHKLNNPDNQYRKCHMSWQCIEGITCEIPDGCYACCKGDINGIHKCTHMVPDNASSCIGHGEGDLGGWTYNGPDAEHNEGGFVCDECEGCGIDNTEETPHVCEHYDPCTYDDFSNCCDGPGAIIDCGAFTDDFTNATCGTYGPVGSMTCVTTDCTFTGAGSWTGCCDPTKCNVITPNETCTCVDDGSCKDWDACGVCDGPGEWYDCNEDGVYMACSFAECLDLVPGTWYNQHKTYCCEEYDGEAYFDYPNPVTHPEHPDCTRDGEFASCEENVNSPDKTCEYMFVYPLDYLNSGNAGHRGSYCEPSICGHNYAAAGDRTCGKCVRPSDGHEWWPWEGWDPEDYVRGCVWGSEHKSDNCTGNSYNGWPCPFSPYHGFIDHGACKGVYGGGGSASYCGYYGVNPPEVTGCMDTDACNYNPSATVELWSSCDYPMCGCSCSDANYQNGDNDYGNACSEAECSSNSGGAGIYHACFDAIWFCNGGAGGFCGNGVCDESMSLSIKEHLEKIRQTSSKM